MKYTKQAPKKNIFHTLFFALFLSLVLSGCAATVTRGANGALKWEQCTPILSGERAGVSVRCSTNGQKHEKTEKKDTQEERFTESVLFYW